MINVLPPEGRLRAKREYRIRLYSVWAFALAGVFAVCVGLLLPSYFYAQVGVRNTRAQDSVAGKSLNAQEFSAAVESEKQAGVTLAAVQAQLQYPRASSVLTTVLGTRGSGIVLSRVEYAIGGASATIRLSGVAQTRDSLLSFKGALSAVPGVSGVNLPLELLVTAQNIPFSITLSYKKQIATTTPSILKK